MFRSNVESVSHEMIDALEQIGNCRLDQQANQQISAIIHALGVLALQMGSQRAHIMLETCSHGAQVRPGEKFQNEGDSSVPEAKVDLMTQPCMIRVGDNREDLKVQKVVAQGAIVAM